MVQLILIIQKIIKKLLSGHFLGHFWIRTCVTGRSKISIKNSSACINLVFNFVPQQPDSRARLLLPDVGLANDDDIQKDLKVGKACGVCTIQSAVLTVESRFWQ